MSTASGAEFGRVYVNDRIHTGQIRSETCELLVKTHSVADTAYTRVVKLQEHLGERGAKPAIVRRIVDPNVLTVDLRRDWRRRENRVSGFLRDTRLLASPARDMSKILAAGFDQDLPSFSSTEDVLGFWHFTRTQVQDLLQTVEGGAGNTLRLMMNAYFESRVVRAAVYKGVYLSRLS